MQCGWLPVACWMHRLSPIYIVFFLQNIASSTEQEILHSCVKTSDFVLGLGQRFSYMYVAGFPGCSNGDMLSTSTWEAYIWPSGFPLCWLKSWPLYFQAALASCYGRDSYFVHFHLRSFLFTPGVFIHTGQEADLCCAFRLLWLLALVGMLTWFIFNMVTRVQSFIANPKSVNLEKVFNNTMLFPAITMCNINALTWVNWSCDWRVRIPHT